MGGEVELVAHASEASQPHALIMAPHPNQARLNQQNLPTADVQRLIRSTAVAPFIGRAAFSDDRPQLARRFPI